MEAWNVRDILQYVDENGGTIAVANGQASINFPHSPDRNRFLDTILPHLRVRKAEILVHLEPKPHPIQLARPHLFTNGISPPPTGADPFEPTSEFQRLFVQLEHFGNPERDRKRTLEKLRLEALRLRKPLYLLLRKGQMVLDASKSGIQYGDRPKREVRKRKKKKTLSSLGKPDPIPQERSATHACIPGVTEWIPLPKVTTKEEDLRLNPPWRYKHGKGD